MFFLFFSGTKLLSDPWISRPPMPLQKYASELLSYGCSPWLLPSLRQSFQTFTPSMSQKPIKHSLPVPHTLTQETCTPKSIPRSHSLFSMSFLLSSFQYIIISLPRTWSGVRLTCLWKATYMWRDRWVVLCDLGMGLKSQDRKALDNLNPCSPKWPVIWTMLS